MAQSALSLVLGIWQNRQTRAEGERAPSEHIFVNWIICARFTQSSCGASKILTKFSQRNNHTFLLLSRYFWGKTLGGQHTEAV